VCPAWQIPIGADFGLLLYHDTHLSHLCGNALGKKDGGLGEREGERALVPFLFGSIIEGLPPHPSFSIFSHHLIAFHTRSTHSCAQAVPSHCSHEGRVRTARHNHTALPDSRTLEEEDSGREEGREGEMNGKSIK